MKKISLFLVLLAQGILVSAQQPAYTAVNDTTTAMCFRATIIDVLSNDIFPPGTGVEIWKCAFAVPSQYWTLSKTPDNKLKITNLQTNYLDTLKIYYSFRNKSDTMQFSDTARVQVYTMLNPDSIQAVADTLVFSNVGITQVFDPTLNDIDPIPNDTMTVFGIHQGNSQIQVDYISGNVYKITPRIYCIPGTYTGKYELKHKKSTGYVSNATGKIVFIVEKNNTFAILDTNNVKARINGYGNQFWDFINGTVFEVPKGSGKGTLFNSCLWIGGKDSHDSLHFAGERYRQGAGSGTPGLYQDFFCGPVTDPVNYNPAYDSTWNRVWKITRGEIEYHINHWWEGTYLAPEAILNWPGNGNTSLGQAASLAPYVDFNHDGHYNAMDGDYPVIRGDMAVYFIFNDDRGWHNESGGEKLRTEAQGMAYSFLCPGDTAFDNSVFFHYDLFNRSDQTYTDTYLGVFSDPDIGYANDDYIGCDVERSSYFGYNGKPVDGTGQPYAYGNFPPAQSVTFMAGATMDPDGIDNPKYDNTGHQLCNPSVNGQNFGDSIVDNERFGMTGFMMVRDLIPGLSFTALDYYRLMLGITLYGDTLRYPGHSPPGRNNPPACKFEFPGMSDTLFWGVGCVRPDNSMDWTEEAVSYNPADIKGVGVSGPFTFKPGDKQELDLAYIFAQSKTGDRLASVADLKKDISYILKCFAKDSVPCGKTFSATGKKAGLPERTLRIWPNPAKDFINVDYQASDRNCTYRVVNLLGTGLLQGKLLSGQRYHRISLNLPAGIYMLIITDGNRQYLAKIIIE